MPPTETFALIIGGGPVGLSAAIELSWRGVPNVLVSENLETAIAGTYHHVGPKHAPSYLASFAYRFDRRRQLDSVVERLAWAAVRTAPQPYRLVTADA